jgi:hypothetical protein
VRGPPCLPVHARPPLPAALVGRRGRLQAGCFIVRDANGHALAYSPGQRAAAKVLTRDEGIGHRTIASLWRPRQLRVELGERFLKKAQQSVVSVIDERQKFQRP